MICRQLLAHGKRVGVIIRGFGGEFEFGCRMASDGEQVLLTAKEAGDEAFLLARTLPGVPVAVGKDRIRTGRMLTSERHPDIIVMDDGMQHWRLHRDVDVVLLNACEPFDNGWTVPRGMLREPKRNLRRAGIVILTNARRAGDVKLEADRREISRIAPGIPIFVADLSPVALLGIDGHECKDLEWLNGKRVCALSAIGNPGSFESMLGEQGAILAARSRYSDHHEVTRHELDEVFQKSAEARADAIITTEKDAVKLPKMNGPLPIYVLRVAMLLSDETAFLSSLFSHLGLDGGVGAEAGPRLS